MASLHRFYQRDVGHAPTLIGREAHHALDVLRLRRGETLTLLDGLGHRWLCEIQAHTRDQVELAVREKTFTPAPPCAVTLLTAIPKGKIETIIEKATELGAARIVPLLTERTVVKLDAANAADKVEKWRQVAIESIKQCGSPWLPQIEMPVTPKQFLTRNEPFDLPLVASLEPGTISIRAARQTVPTPRSACLWIGPEGDFTSEEYALIRAASTHAVTLGPLVLRADTAVIASLSVLQHELRA